MTATPEDSAFCQLCDPPYETSLAMLPVHLREVHGIDPQELADAAEIVDPDGA